MPNVMAAQPNTGGALCKSCVISFLVYHAARLGRLERKVNFAPGKIPSGARAPENVYNVAARETAKHRAKFGWPPVSDVAAVTLPRRETR